MFDRRCRTCHYFNNGICEARICDINVYGSYVDTTKLIEEGHLDAVVSSTAESIEYDTMLSMLRGMLSEYKVSQKKIKSVEEELNKILEERISEQIKRKFNSNIERLLMNHTDELSYDITVTDDEFHCSNWK